MNEIQKQKWLKHMKVSIGHVDRFYKWFVSFHREFKNDYPVFYISSCISTLKISMSKDKSFWLCFYQC